MKIRSPLFYWYSLLVLVFTGLTLLPAPSREVLTKYHLNATSVRFLDLTIIIIEAAIWYVAFYGYNRLSRYSRAVHSGKEGKHIARLARGLLFLSVGLPVSAITSSIFSLIVAHHPGFKAGSIVVQNYASIVFPLLAFGWISRGARGLSDVSKTRPTFRMVNVVAIMVLVLGVVFCCIIVAAHKELRATYHMSPELVMLTIGIPYMYIWFMGLLGAAELQQYSRKLTGIVYRRCWLVFIRGLVALIFVSILLQYLTALSSWITSLSLGALLLLLYVLLLVLALSYIVVALGAQKLMKIEEA